MTDGSDTQASILAEVRKRVEAEDSAVVATVVAGPTGVGSRMLIYPNGSTRAPRRDRKSVV